MKIGFTGTRDGMSEAQKQRFVELLAGLSEFHHGDCIGGDEDSHLIVRQFMPGARITVHPPDNPSRRAFVQDADAYREPAPYLERNRYIVDETDSLIATPVGFDEEVRSGTWFTVRYARQQGRPIKIIYPDGSVAEEPGLVVSDTQKET